MTQYEHALIAMERLLVAVGEEHWANWIREDLHQWNVFSDGWHHLYAYGGMGSFNDFAISHESHTVETAQEPWANALLESLQAVCCHLARHPNQPVTAETLRRDVGRYDPSIPAFRDGEEGLASAGTYASEQSLNSCRCLDCGHAQASRRDIDSFIAKDVVPSLVFRACEALALEVLVDKTLALGVPNLAEARRQVRLAAEASGIVVCDSVCWMETCTNCGKDATALYRWTLVPSEMRFYPTDDNLPMRKSR